MVRENLYETNRGLGLVQSLMVELNGLVRLRVHGKAARNQEVICWQQLVGTRPRWVTREAGISART